MPWKCPVCGHVNDDEAEFCLNCGAPRPEASGQQEAEGPAVPREEPAEETTAAAVAPESGAEAATEEAAEKEEKPAEEGKGEAAAAGNLYLEIVDTPAHELIGKKVPLMLNTFPKISIGRSLENVIVIPDPTVSRHHAVVEKKPDGTVVIRDLGSTNGTYVYDEETGVFRKIEEEPLRPGMLIKLGERTIVRIAAE